MGASRRPRRCLRTCIVIITMLIILPRLNLRTVFKLGRDSNSDRSQYRLRQIRSNRNASSHRFRFAASQRRCLDALAQTIFGQVDMLPPGLLVVHWRHGDKWCGNPARYRQQCEDFVGTVAAIRSAATNRKKQIVYVATNGPPALRRALNEAGFLHGPSDARSIEDAPACLGASDPGLQNFLFDLDLMLRAQAVADFGTRSNVMRLANKVREARGLQPSFAIKLTPPRVASRLHDAELLAARLPLAARLEPPQPASKNDVVQAIGKGSSAKTIFMVGDSCLRRTFFKLCAMLGQKHIKSRRGQAALCQGNVHGRRLKVTFAGIIEYGWTRPDAIPMLVNRTNAKPDVIVFNGGLHFLHLIPARAWGPLGRPHDGYPHWRDAEKELETFLDACGKVTPHVIFQTSHAICDEKYVGTYADAVRSFKQDHEQFVRPCVKHLVDTHATSPSLARAQCLNGTFTSDGVSKLNRRLLRTYDAYTKTHNDMIGDVVDGFKLTTNACRYTTRGDGRHYEPLEYNELVAMFDLLEDEKRKR